MRVNLNVPFEQKDQAKRLGAKWDAARRIWYVEDHPHLDHFAQWVPSLAKKKSMEKWWQLQLEVAPCRPEPLPSLPSCNCTSPPWEDCEHTAPLAEDIDPEVRAMLRDMLPHG